MSCYKKVSPKSGSSGTGKCHTAPTTRVPASPRPPRPDSIQVPPRLPRSGKRRVQRGNGGTFHTSWSEWCPMPAVGLDFPWSSQWPDSSGSALLTPGPEPRWRCLGKTDGGEHRTVENMASSSRWSSCISLGLSAGCHLGHVIQNLRNSGKPLQQGMTSLTQINPQTPKIKHSFSLIVCTA